MRAHRVNSTQIAVHAAAIAQYTQANPLSVGGTEPARDYTQVEQVDLFPISLY